MLQRSNMSVLETVPPQILDNSKTQRPRAIIAKIIEHFNYCFAEMVLSPKFLNCHVLPKSGWRQKGFLLPFNNRLTANTAISSIKSLATITRLATFDRIDTDVSIVVAIFDISFPPCPSCSCFGIWIV